MKAGQLNTLIEIQRKHIDISESGAQLECWHRHIKTKSSVKYLSGSRKIDNTEIFFENMTEFKIRYYHDVKHTDRIYYNDSLYRIISINPNKKENCLTIQTELINE